MSLGWHTVLYPALWPVAVIFIMWFSSQFANIDFIGVVSTIGTISVNVNASRGIYFSCSSFDWYDWSSIFKTWACQLVTSITFCSYSFLSLTYIFFSCDYSSTPCHQPADSTHPHNCFLLSASSDIFDSFPLTHMCFFMIPSHSIRFYLFCYCSGLSWVSSI